MNKIKYVFSKSKKLSNFINTPPPFEENQLILYLNNIQLKKLKKEKGKNKKNFNSFFIIIKILKSY